ncbi:MAG: hypothetical protein PPP58_07025 [Natronomonas sp.]
MFVGPIDLGKRDERIAVNPQYRDGILAVFALGITAGIAALTAGVGPIVDPIAVATGIVGASLLEAAFLRHSEWLLSVWERRGVPIVGFCVVVSIAAGAVGYAPRLLGAIVWGLLVYLLLLGCVLTGVGNPLGFLGE